MEAARRAEGARGRVEAGATDAGCGWLPGSFFSAGGSFEDIRRAAYLSNPGEPRSVSANSSASQTAAPKASWRRQWKLPSELAPRVCDD